MLEITDRGLGLFPENTINGTNIVPASLEATLYRQSIRFDKPVRIGWEITTQGTATSKPIGQMSDADRIEI